MADARYPRRDTSPSPSLALASDGSPPSPRSRAERATKPALLDVQRNARSDRSGPLARRRRRWLGLQEIEEREEELGFLGAGDHVLPLEDEAGHRVDADPARAHVLGHDFLGALAAGQEPRGLLAVEAGFLRDLRQRRAIAD